ncbi:EF_hand domain-containing protein [Hexamita inflata]|uniref:EF_hand domain-containing protein n=1 Tax=Hexamita inflata TaxID=28002 RepID=A0ABP1HKB5_9EUKA
MGCDLQQLLMLETEQNQSNCKHHRKGAAPPSIRVKNTPNQSTAQVSCAQFTKPELDKCKQVFEQIDKDGSGMLDLTELESAFSQMGNNMSRSQILSMMNLWDLTESDQLNFQQFLHMTYISQNSEESNQAKMLFLLADSDFSGCIDVKELEKIFAKLGVNMETGQVRSLISQVSKGKSELSYIYRGENESWPPPSLK